MPNKIIKHSGADWMQRQDNFSDHSKFGEKVADILGQVYLGIYHISGTVQSPKVDWKNHNEISVTIFGELATFDRCKLTFLILCCVEAGVSVSVSGAFKNYTKLTFSAVRTFVNLTLRSIEIDSEWLNKSANDVSGLYASKKKNPIWEYQDPYDAAFSLSKTFDMLELIDLVLIAHTAKTRISIQGRSFGSLQMQFTQRAGRKGAIWDRHPTFEAAQNSLKPYYSALAKI